MKISELKILLADMPGDAEVMIVYDGAARARADKVWLSKSGKLLISSHDESIYYIEDTPENVLIG